MTDLQVKAMTLSIITIEITESLLFVSAFSFIANLKLKNLKILAIIFIDAVTYINFIGLFAFCGPNLSGFSKSIKQPLFKMP